MWTPEWSADAAPRYRALADAIARDVQCGRLAAGDRLPTHRQLARRLGVTVGTVTRGYQEAARRGLVQGEVGRGTFVASPGTAAGWGTADAGERGVADLSLSLPPLLEEEGELLAGTLSRIASDRRSVGLLQYQPGTATLVQRERAASWLAGTGLSVDPGQVVVTAGAQHALLVTLSALFRPGDVVLAAELTYPGIKSLAELLGLPLRPVELDREGVVVDSLAAACRAEPRPAGLYLVPTLQNPTGGTLSPSRREAVAELVRRHGLKLVEDDVHVFLPPQITPPIATLIPERTVYVLSVSKAVNMGLRTGFAVAPPQWTEQLAAGTRATMWMPPPLMVEVATRWLADGTAERLIERKRSEILIRQARAREILRGRWIQGDPHAYHLWLWLPPPWRSDELVTAARRRGVLVAGAGAFLVGRREVPHAVRISLGAVADRERLTESLEVLAAILEAGPGAGGSLL